MVHVASMYLKFVYGQVAARPVICSDIGRTMLTCRLACLSLFHELCVSNRAILLRWGGIDLVSRIEL
jgi:hypothetical protein